LLCPSLRLPIYLQTSLHPLYCPLLDTWRTAWTRPPVHSADDLQFSRCYPSLLRISKTPLPQFTLTSRFPSYHICLSFEPGHNACSPGSRGRVVSTERQPRG
jgi:hypothetical protein